MNYLILTLMAVLLALLVCFFLYLTKNRFVVGKRFGFCLLAGYAAFFIGLWTVDSKAHD